MKALQYLPVVQSLSDFYLLWSPTLHQEETAMAYQCGFSPHIAKGPLSAPLCCQWTHRCPVFQQKKKVLWGEICLNFKGMWFIWCWRPLWTAICLWVRVNTYFIYYLLSFRNNEETKHFKRNHTNRHFFKFKHCIIFVNDPERILASHWYIVHKKVLG